MSGFLSKEHTLLKICPIMHLKNGSLPTRTADFMKNEFCAVIPTSQQTNTERNY